MQLGWVQFRSREPCTAGSAAIRATVGTSRCTRRTEENRERDLDVHGRIGAAAAAARLGTRTGPAARSGTIRSRAEDYGLGGLRALLGRLVGPSSTSPPSVFPPSPSPPGLDLSLLAAVVGGVEAGALEEDRHRVEHLLERALRRRSRTLRRRVVHPLERPRTRVRSGSGSRSRHRRARLAAGLAASRVNNVRSCSKWPRILRSCRETARPARAALVGELRRRWFELGVAAMRARGRARSCSCS